MKLLYIVLNNFEHMGLSGDDDWVIALVADIPRSDDDDLCEPLVECAWQNYSSGVILFRMIRRNLPRNLHHQAAAC